MGMKHSFYLFIFFEKKKSKWQTPKNWDFQLSQFLIFFSKNVWIGPLVSSIDWCKGYWCGSTYMAMRLSNISWKTGKKCIFGIFRPFLSVCRTASLPYRLSHIKGIFASINPPNSRTNSENLKNIYGELAELKNSLFLSRPFWIFFWIFFVFFCFIPMKISQSVMSSKDGSKFWWLPWFTAKE